ncbi:alternative NAD(P)H-ubiquinone oxidoreductase C1 [Forsythia ovata]|uniref:Alternative NAD(P)H-ubiquinone oxidoreductase C1 n=1 Tax=Forsythia ovata TaxID=205694 RepID=A0ABD1WTR2_9LAMI
MQLQMASTIYPAATLPLVNCTFRNAQSVMQCGQFRRGKLFTKHSRKYSTNSRLFSSPAGRRGLHIVASGTATQYGSVMEVSGRESEPPIYAWPDNNKVGLL